MSELYHHGILGMKWGVRRYQNEDGTLTDEGKQRYSKEQFNRDKAVYGRSGAKRIERRVNQGESVSGARSIEADRIANARKAARVGGQTGKTVGSIAGGIGGFLAGNLLRNAFATKVPALNDPVVGSLAHIAITTGMASVGSQLGSYGGQSVAMITGGYSPSKYR